MSPFILIYSYTVITLVRQKRQTVNLEKNIIFQVFHTCQDLFGVYIKKNALNYIVWVDHLFI